MPKSALQPAFVLIRPQMGENIGAAARAMLNFGLDHMRIVNPRDGWPNQAAVTMASGAGRVLDGAQLFETTADALADCSLVLATTARARGLTKPVYSPEKAMELTAEQAAQGKKVAILFGPERAGLENEDIAKANGIISVPVNPDFPSLNLAQCVLLTGYEWQRQISEITHEIMEIQRGDDLANGGEIEALAQHYEDRLEEAGFFFPEAKSASMRINLRNLWSRMPLTSADAQMMHGILRQMVRWKDRG